MSLFCHSKIYVFLYNNYPFPPRPKIPMAPTDSTFQWLSFQKVVTMESHRPPHE
uniref:Uncharacterized protein n=1 Tax=Anguilla anguilla TaxID=7936 RepID=A0A0E9UCB7_ANGAN